jgi:quercetin dioxygenase-like cupin family protein
VACTRVDFPALPWTAGGHPLERKKACSGRPIVMLEFAPGFADPNWCERAHLIFVISGVLEFELGAEVERFTAGQCCAIDAGTAHRARNGGSECVVAFVASEVALPG